MDSTPEQDLIDAGRLFHSRGWVPASGGNFSYLRAPNCVVITASGCHKGELAGEDLMQVSLDGEPIDTIRRSSAETLLHTQVYRRMLGVSAVLHTHSVAATVLSRRLDSIRLSGYELQKILPGIDTHDCTVDIPVFENDQDMGRLSARIDAQMAKGKAVCGYLIRGHGLYAWGESVRLARYRTEALEFMFECELKGAGGL